MYKLYEKVPKTKKYMYGSRPIDSDETPFLEGPCLLCISAQYDFTGASKSNFGVTKEGMKMARVRVRNHKNAGFSLIDFPVKFLSLELDEKDEDEKMTSDERVDAFVTKHLLPLITNNGQKIDCLKAMKNMRNVNMMSYCDGTTLVQAIEKSLISKMQELGYTDEECEKIQSQMCMFPISTNRLSGRQKSTCVSFKDINDVEVNDNVTPEEIQAVSDSSIGEGVFSYSDNEVALLFSGNGKHHLKKYTYLDTPMTVCLSSAVTKALENSILNSSGEKFVPITARNAYMRF